MFASLKNKIREETGSDITKLTQKLTSTPAQKIETLRSRSARDQQGSTSSLNSIVSSSDGNVVSNREDGFVSDEDDFKKRLAKIESDYAKKLAEKEKQLKELANDSEKKVQNLEKEKCEAHKQIVKLKESLKAAEDMQQKLVEHKVDKEQIENFQTQELSKVKHLVLTREHDLSEKNNLIKEMSQQIEKLRNEVTRLRRFEEQLNDLQQNATVEIKAVQKNLENTESELDKTEEESDKLRLSLDSEHQANVSLKQLVTKLEKELNEEKSNSLDVQKTLTRVTSEKNAVLLRNAEISQQMELVKQDTRRQEIEMTELTARIQALEEENRKFKEKESKGVEQELRNKLSVLEQELVEKNKTIKTLQLRLADMKKTLQQELKSPGNSFYDTDGATVTNAAVLQPSLSTTKNAQKNYHGKLARGGTSPGGGAVIDEEDVNFKYLKHVIIKFLTSREYEAQHLTRAVSTLLKFTRDEEKLLHDTLEWRMSWFGSKPKITSTSSSSSSSSSSSTSNSKLLPRS